MISIGVDAHKTLHVAVAIDDAGRVLAEWSGPNSPADWARFHVWLQTWQDQRHVGIEGSGSYGKGLARYLITQGEHVFEVNSRLTARERRLALKRGKSDRLDAIAIARAILREGEQLPRIVENDDAAVLSHLSEERDSLVNEATRLRNRLHAVLMQLDPQYKEKEPRLTRKAVARLEAYDGPAETALAREQLRSVRRLASHLGRLLDESDELANRIEQLAQERYSELTKIVGVSHLTAGTLAGILGSHAPFHSDAQLAAYAGVAPLEASSAGNGRHRLSRLGNRRLNAIVYRIAIAQLRHPGLGRTYVDGRLAQRHTKREAIRSLKRYIVRAIWQRWKRCQTPVPLVACP